MMENIKYKTLLINQDNKLCYIDDKEISLTKKEYELLKFFLENPNYIHSREELINKIWNKEVSERTIDTNIMRLRNKLGPYKDNLITRIGFGYGFNIEVS